MIVSRGTPLCSMPHTFWNTGRQAWIVPLSVIFSARRDELWGRFLGVPPGSGGLSIRLPPLYAPATAVKNRQHRLRLAAMRGRMVSCARPRGYAGQPALVGLLTSDSGGLPTRRRLKTCPTVLAGFQVLGKVCGIAPLCWATLRRIEPNVPCRRGSSPGIEIRSWCTFVYRHRRREGSSCHGQNLVADKVKADSLSAIAAVGFLDNLEQQ
jgi:hypothetical protein